VSSGVSDRVLSQLLTELDGVHVSYALIVPAVLLPYAFRVLTCAVVVIATQQQTIVAHASQADGLFVVCCYRA
jgi:SpoVK/Ycf46/Vps4 family AAA+-type ATPase